MISFGHNVFRAHEPFLNGGGHAPFQKHRHIQTAHRLQKVKILHISGADLDDIHALFQEHTDFISTHQLRHHRHIFLMGSGNEKIQALLP